MCVRTQFLLCPPCRPCHRATPMDAQPLANPARPALPPSEQGWLPGKTGDSCPPTDLVRRSCPPTDLALLPTWFDLVRRHVGAVVPHVYSAFSGRQHGHMQGRMPGGC